MKIQLAIIQTAILSLVFLFAPKCVSAQEIPSPANITSSDLQGRFGGVIKWSPYDTEAFFVEGALQLRLNNNFTSVDRFHTAIRVNLWLAQIDYVLINAYDSMTKQWISPHHRVNLNLHGGWNAGPIRFELRERLQTTFYSNSVNKYERRDPELILRSRLTLAYVESLFHWRWTPYILFELNNSLNSPAVVANYKDEALSTDNYITRYRTGIGTKYFINRKNHLDIYYYFDYDRSKDINYNSINGNLESYKMNNQMRHIFGIRYHFQL